MSNKGISTVFNVLAAMIIVTILFIIYIGIYPLWSSFIDTFLASSNDIVLNFIVAAFPFAFLIALVGLIFVISSTGGR